MTLHSALPSRADIACPASDAAVPIETTDVLVLAHPRRMVVQRGLTENGDPELRLYYGDKEISFDEPHLFAFGETLARTSRFAAGDSMAWGEGFEWPTVRPLLESLVEQGILTSGDPKDSGNDRHLDRACPSPLPAAVVKDPRWWGECEQITRDLAGRAIEAGWLELVVPVFRVAHVALDADGRQVGEASVFPRDLRLDVPTDWMTCVYPGTRYLSDRPMNATALRAMRAHWPAMMSLLESLRERFLTMFPEVRDGWTVATLERFATLVLAVPTYQLVRPCDPVASGNLHPVLSNLFRVTDGLRMTMHQMLFVPVGEPTLAPDEPMDAARIHDYAERNYSFHSETGVCAGPRIMVQAFLDTVVEGGDARPVAFEPDVQRALDDVDAAFAYGLRGLRAHAALFCLWPAMARAYEALATVSDEAVAAGLPAFLPLRDRMREHLESLRHRTYLGSAERRMSREAAYGAIYDGCAGGLADVTSGLADAFATARTSDTSALRAQVDDALALTSLPPGPWRDQICRVLCDHAAEAQAILRVAVADQHALNATLGRANPVRPFSAADADVHALLQGHAVRRLPFLLDELRDVLGLDLSISTDAVDARWVGHGLTQQFVGDPVSAGTVPVGCGATLRNQGARP